MAITQISASDAQAVKLFSKMLFRESLGYTQFFKKLLGDTKESVLYWKRDLEKTAGDQIKYDLLLDLVDEGKTGSDLIERNTEALQYKQDAVLIDQQRFGTGYTRMSEQRSLHDFRNDSKDALKVRFGKWFDYSMFRMFGGDTTFNFAGNTGTLPDAYHYYMCGDVTVGDGSGTIEDDEALISNNDQIVLQDLDHMKEKALTAGTNAMRPIRIEGEDYLVLFLHPYCFTDLRTNVTSSTNTTWMDIQMYANRRGLKNPIFTGAEGVYNGIIIYQTKDVYSPLAVSTTGRVYRNVLLGAQAGCFATGNPNGKMMNKMLGKDLPMSWSEESYDHGDKMEVVAGIVCGFKKARFADHAGTTRDYGCLVASAYSANRS